MSGLASQRLAWLLALGAALASVPAGAFSPQTQAAIAREAAALAPPDLARQIDRHQLRLREGALLPFQDKDPRRHLQEGAGAGELERVIGEEVERAVGAIRSHRPFAEIVTQLGVVSHFVADANNPLNTSSSDPREADYFADYLRYVDSALPRFPLVYYGLDRGLDGRREAAVSGLVGRALSRGRGLYPLLGKEYRRVGFATGAQAFDDRSTAFGIASLTFSHAVNDVSQVFRHIWLRAGGADQRPGLPLRGERLLALPRATRGQP